MGQAGAQREPSMEEILASIRRIIENNEPGQDVDPVNAGDATGHEDDAAVYAEDYAEPEADIQHTAANDAPAAQPGSQPVSLAEVAARARAVPDPIAENNASTNIHHEILDSAAEPDDAAVDDAAAEELRAALTSDEPVEAAPEVVAEAPEPAQEDVVAPRTEADNVAQPAAQTPAPATHQAGGQLVSLHTGEKVAAAFGELDAAIAAGQQRSFDEIAEEMLRPMLTQWLDDNLPTLVERLVREEIERVSRGNRR